MKNGLYTLTLPALWLLQIGSLAGLILIHIMVAPVRAFIYWGRDLEENPGWRGFGSCAKETGIEISKKRGDR